MRIKTLIRILAGALSINALAPIAQAYAEQQRLGVYYYSGWFASPWTMPQVWQPIKQAGDRSPVLGWYDPRSPEVMRRQLSWMRDYSIDYAVFGWTYSDRAEHLGDPIDAYLAVDQTAVDFALLWANHDEATKPADMRAISDLWVRRYLRSPKYLTVAGKPVIFIFSLQKLRDDARASGSSLAAYFALAERQAKAAGLPGLYFVGGVDDTSDSWIAREAIPAGLDAVSAYNFHRKPRAAGSTDPDWWKATRGGFVGLDQAYRAQWAAANSLSVPLVVPMTAGWDKRPWGGSEDPAHDRSIASTSSFRQHLLAGRDAMTHLADRNEPLGVICCWNEFGEGSFIEPTQQMGFSKLDQIRAVFQKR